MKAPETGRLWRLFLWKMYGYLARKQVSASQHHSLYEFKQQERTEEILDTVHGFSCLSGTTSSMEMHCGPRAEIASPSL
jgi:hypothetical protein